VDEDSDDMEVSDEDEDGSDVANRSLIPLVDLLPTSLTSLRIFQLHKSMDLGELDEQLQDIMKSPRFEKLQQIYSRRREPHGIDIAGFAQTKLKANWYLLERTRAANGHA
jgi:hypothetical protein